MWPYRMLREFRVEIDGLFRKHLRKRTPRTTGNVVRGAVNVCCSDPRRAKTAVRGAQLLEELFAGVVVVAADVVVAVVLVEVVA